MHFPRRRRSRWRLPRPRRSAECSGRSFASLWNATTNISACCSRSRSCSQRLLRWRSVQCGSSSSCMMRLRTDPNGSASSGWRCSALRRRWCGGGLEEPPQGAARRARLEPAGPGRAARRLAPERQCDRDRQIRSFAAARLSNLGCLRAPDRADLPARVRSVALPRRLTLRPGKGTNPPTGPRGHTRQYDDDGAETAFGFDGTWQEFAPIAFTNLLLTIVTLGICRFWATTRERQYFWSRTRFVDERLEWAGTGMELFIGFLLVLVVC